MISLVRLLIETVNDEEFIQLWNTILDPAEVGERIGVATQSVISRASKLRSRGRDVTALKQHHHISPGRFVRAWEDGETLDDVAQSLGISRDQVQVMRNNRTGVW
jgi:biotin operon repressor